MAIRTAVGHRAYRISAALCVVAVAVVALVVSASGPPGRAASAATARQSTIRSASSKSSTALSPPKTTFSQDTKFFTDVTEADPSLVVYEQKDGDVALQALLTDGSAFCAFLRRGGGIDKALVEEAEGARSTETRTSLPLSVTTFNTIESVALLTLCPSKQKLIPATDRAKIRALGKELGKSPG